MNLYKFNFNLAGSSNALKTITIPSDSKYSMGLKFFNGNEELILGDDVQITIQDDKYIYTPTEIFNNYAVFAGSTHNGTKTYRVNFHKDGEPEVDVNFKGITVRTNDSKISNWAVTDSQMKIVYTDEWETMKDTADDRVIYFVVDRPTPPTPVPPKPVPPTPGGDGEYFNLCYTVKDDDPEFDNFTEDAEYNPNEYNPKYIGERGVKATYRGKTVYLDQMYNSSSQAEIVEVEGDRYKKIDQRAILLDLADWDPENYYISVYGIMIENGKLYSIQLDKKFNSEDEMNEYYTNYLSVFGEDGDIPGDAGIPADLDDFEINEESKFAFEDRITSIISKVDTDKYYWVYGSVEFEPEVNSEMKLKLWKVDTYPQWQPVIF